MEEIWSKYQKEHKNPKPSSHLSRHTGPHGHMAQSVGRLVRHADQAQQSRGRASSFPLLSHRARKARVPSTKAPSERVFVIAQAQG